MSTYTQNFVYIVTDNNGLHKIGKSQDPKLRLSNLQVANTSGLSLMYTIECESSDAALKLEKELHDKFIDAHVRGEWFKLEDSHFEQLQNEYSKTLQNEEVAIFDTKVLEHLLEILTKNELKRFLRIASRASVNDYNILNKKFKDFTKDIHDTDRSRFKRKLIDNKLIVDSGNTIMLNPTMFIARSTDKSIYKLWDFLSELTEDIPDCFSRAMK